MFTYISKSEKDTKNFAKLIAEKLNSKDIIVLTGELGSGKTKFVEGILSYFNLDDEISSPTFTIVNEHYTKKLNLYHFDVYRLEDIDEFYEMGGEEYFDKGACIIEWGEIIQQSLPMPYIHIIFNKNEENENLRTLNIEIIGSSKKWSDFFENTCH